MKTNKKQEEEIIREHIGTLVLSMVDAAKYYGCKTVAELLSNKEFAKWEHYPVCKMLVDTGAITADCCLLMELAM